MRRQQGFTLIEIVLVLIMLAVMAGVAGSMLRSSSGAFTQSQLSLQANEQMRYITERIALEVRAVNPVAGGFEINTMNVDQLQFVKSDGTAVTISYATPLLAIAYDSLPGVLASLSDKVSSFQFNYYQLDGVTPASTQQQIYFIETNLVISIDGQNFPQRSRVGLRVRL